MSDDAKSADGWSAAALPQGCFEPRAVAFEFGSFAFTASNRLLPTSSRYVHEQLEQMLRSAQGETLARKHLLAKYSTKISLTQLEFIVGAMSGVVVGEDAFCDGRHLFEPSVPNPLRGDIGIVCFDDFLNQ